jgi:hypothetical protein
MNKYPCKSQISCLMAISSHLCSAYELYIATTEDGQRAASETGPRDPEKPRDGVHDGSNNQPPPSRTCWFKRKRKFPVDPLMLSQRFKQTLARRNVKVHFVGAWRV